jgi:hypothetical protein
MNTAGARRVSLLAHPDGGAEFVSSVAAEAQLTAGAHLCCRYTLRGDTARLRLPQAGGGRRADGLWRHTCFEAFISAAGTAGYYEFNFSPALDWAAYRFDDYRTGMNAATLEQAPALEVRRSSDGLELTASVHLEGLAPLREARSLRLALAAVIEENDGRLAYWALWHPPGKPDFHHPEGFTLELPPA